MTKFSFVETIKCSKLQFSGLAIILIILCHLVVVDPTLPFVKVFTPGFIGVDIFIFYSGFSLGFSYTKRSLKEFYIKRVKRILPMFLLFAILSSIIHICRGETLNAFDWFCNLTTLSYYGVGGFPIDWYLSSIALFYLAYPLLYKLVDITKHGGVIALSICVLCLIIMFDFDEYYGCAISRIPIYSLGIWFFQMRESNRLAKSFTILSIVFCLIMCIGAVMPQLGFYMHGYFLVDMFCPISMIFIAILVVAVHNCASGSRIENAISYLGKHSLEVYVANFLSMGVIGLFVIDNCYYKAFLYFLINLCLCVVLINVYNLINLFIDNVDHSIN